MNQGRVVFLLVAILMLAALPSCDGNDVKSIVLSPMALQTIEKGKNDDALFSCFPMICGPGKFGTSCAPGPLGPGGVKVGFSWFYDDGTPPCNCWQYVNCAWRGGVRFDLTSLIQSLVNPSGPVNVVTAMLKWDFKGACATQLFVPQSGWGSWSGGPDEVITASPGPGQISVTSYVKPAVAGQNEFITFVLMGSDESFPEDSTVGHCDTEVNGFTLEVVYTGGG